MLRAAEHLVRAVLVGERLLEQAETELHTENAAAGGIQYGNIHLSALDQMLDRVLPHVVRKIVKLQIHARFQTETDGLLRGGGDEMPVIQTGNRRQVGAHKARHAILAAQHVGQQLVVHRDGDAVDRVVAAHRIARAAVHERGLEHRQAIAEHVVPPHRAGRAVQAAHGVSVAGVVLRLSGDSVGIGQVFALHPAHHLARELTAQMRVLAVGFLPASIARIADQIHDGAVGFMNALRAALRADGASHFTAERGVKGGGQTDLLREAGRFAGHQAVQRFLAEQKRDTQPRVFQRVPLDGVRLRGVHAAQLDAAHAETVQQLIQTVQVHRGDKAVLVLRGKVAGEVLIRLQDFFPQRHARQQILDALLHRQLGVLIRKHGKSTSLITGREAGRHSARSAPSASAGRFPGLPVSTVPDTARTSVPNGRQARDPRHAGRSATGRSRSTA